MSSQFDENVTGVVFVCAKKHTGIQYGTDLGSNHSSTKHFLHSNRPNLLNALLVSCGHLWAEFKSENKKIIQFIRLRFKKEKNIEKKFFAAVIRKICSFAAAI